MINDLKTGTVSRNSAEFLVLREYAKSGLADIYPEGVKLGFMAKIAAHVEFSKLNARLSYYGWAIKRNGEMISVRTRDEAVEGGAAQEELAYRPQAEREEMRRGLISHGNLVDPSTGRVIPLNRRREFGI